MDGDDEQPRSLRKRAPVNYFYSSRPSNAFNNNNNNYYNNNNNNNNNTIPSAASSAANTPSKQPSMNARQATGNRLFVFGDTDNTNNNNNNITTSARKQRNTSNRLRQSTNVSEDLLYRGADGDNELDNLDNNSVDLGAEFSSPILGRGNRENLADIMSFNFNTTTTTTNTNSNNAAANTNSRNQTHIATTTFQPRFTMGMSSSQQPSQQQQHQHQQHPSSSSRNVWDSVHKATSKTLSAAYNASGSIYQSAKKTIQDAGGYISSPFRATTHSIFSPWKGSPLFHSPSTRMSSRKSTRSQKMQNGDADAYDDTFDNPEDGAEEDRLENSDKENGRRATRGRVRSRAQSRNASPSKMTPKTTRKTKRMDNNDDPNQPPSTVERSTVKFSYGSNLLLTARKRMRAYRNLPPMEDDEDDEAVPPKAPYAFGDMFFFPMFLIVTIITEIMVLIKDFIVSSFNTARSIGIVQLSKNAAFGVKHSVESIYAFGKWVVVDNLVRKPRVRYITFGLILISPLVWITGEYAVVRLMTFSHSFLNSSDPSVVTSPVNNEIIYDDSQSHQPKYSYGGPLSETTRSFLGIVSPLWFADWISELEWAWADVNFDSTPFKFMTPSFRFWSSSTSMGSSAKPVFVPDSFSSESDLRAWIASEMSTLRHELGSVESSLQTQLASMHKTHVDADARLADKIAGLTRQLSELESKHAKSASSVVAHRDELQTLSSELQSLSSQITEFTQSVGSLQTRMAAMEESSKQAWSSLPTRIHSIVLEEMTRYLPNVMVASMDAQTGQIRMKPEFWKYLETRLVTKERVESLFKENRDEKVNESKESNSQYPSWQEFIEENKSLLDALVEGKLDQQLQSSQVLVRKADVLKYLDKEFSELSVKVEEAILMKLRSEAEGRTMSKNESEAIEVSQKSTDAANSESIKTLISTMISSALTKYSQDTLSLPDYALESAGGSVLFDHTSKTFSIPLVKSHGNDGDNVNNKGSVANWLWDWAGVSKRVKVSGKSPLQVIIGRGSGGKALGECWPMEGSSGHITLQLARPVYPTDITIEHISEQVAFAGKKGLASAPRDIQVFGVYDVDSFSRSMTDVELSSGDLADLYSVNSVSSSNARPAGILLSSLTYDPFHQSGPSSKKATTPTQTALGNAVQSFPVRSSVQLLTKRFGPVPAVMVRVVNNWGKKEYTCLYRVRVHGRE